MNDIRNYLKELDLRELHRIYKNETKEYLSLELSVFNAGAVVRCKLTNNCYGGGECITYNDDYLKTLVFDVIKGRMTSLCNTWTRLCYEYTFEDFLKTYKLSESMYRKLLKISGV